MKRCMLVLTVLLATTLAWLNAQEHMMFMKTPIDGTISEFATKMRAKGFVQAEVGKNCIIMEGEFMGKDCVLGIHGTSRTKTVWKVLVVFTKDYTSWYSIKRDYTDIVDSYTEKYGIPSDTYHFFSSPYYEGDGYEIQALKMDKCTYRNFWLNLKYGSIEISMTQNAQIKIGYEDRLNGDKRDTEEQSQINDDI